MTTKRLTLILAAALAALVAAAAATAYPICTYTYVILPTKSDKATELRKTVFWALTQGQKPQYTAKLLFVPLPKPVLVAAEQTLKKIHS